VNGYNYVEVLLYELFVLMAGYNSLNYCGDAKMFVSFASPMNGLLPA
jgi:hypothetical protein